MSFKREKVKQAGLEITILKNTENNTQIQILPDFGALWHGWIVKKNGTEINLIDHYKDSADLKNNLRDSHQSANLTPFACRIPDGKYTFKGKQYEFVNKFKDGSAIHGLLVDKPFRDTEIEEGEDTISATFRYEYRQEDKGYPFDYDCEVTYILHKDDSLTLNTKVKNVSKEDIPIVDGWHPYFTTGTKINDCLLQFSSKQEVEFDENLIPTGKLLPYRKFEKVKKVKDTELDNSFVIDEKASQPICTFEDVEKNIKIQIKPSENYPILQIYTPPHRKSIALETLSGAPDAFNNGIGLIVLSPGEEKLFSTTYALKL